MKNVRMAKGLHNVNRFVIEPLNHGRNTPKNPLKMAFQTRKMSSKKWHSVEEEKKLSTT
jgi:hypothetical protein